MKQDTPAIAAWRNLIAYHSEVIYRIERELKEAGAISLSAYDILIELENAPEKRMRMYDLAEACVLTKSGVTKIVNTLEKQKLLKREKCPSDLRGFHVVLTPAGGEAVRKAWPVYRDAIGRYFTKALTSVDIDELGRIIPKLRSSLQ